MQLHPQLRNPNIYLMILSDAVVFAIAIAIAYLFRFELSLSRFYIQQLQNLIIWLVPLKIIVFISLGIYRGMWRYTSISDFWLLARACLISTLIIMVIILYTTRFGGYSRAVFIIDALLSFIFTGGIRLMIRSYFTAYVNPKIGQNAQSKVHLKKVLIIGAGAAGEKILREIMENNELHLEVVGFVDDDVRKQGRSIHGIQVFGTVDQLTSIIERKNAQEILIATPSASGNEIRRIVEACANCNISYKILPGISGLIDGRVSVKVLRDISYEDFLSRPPVNLNIEGIRNYLDGKTVLITGCGGSIGSELCRQVIKYKPRSVILLDSTEVNLFNIQMEMKNEKKFFNSEAILGRVQDEELMDALFQKYKPQVVFHAAAYKHVPMLEKNPWEAVFNNIIGSRVAMEISVKHNVERFVLVSTDKAVRPTNVMGASKRVTELIAQSMQGQGTRLMSVRFGNVVGSSGSVIPVFRRQIEQGGPVTVTHPEVNRYFMTIPEAAQMILQAGAMGEGGEIFILRMGTPVKIADMARDLIRLSGKKPDVDIKIVFTGLREGEKLYEELIAVGEDILPTSHDKIMVLRSINHFNGQENILAPEKSLQEGIDELLKEAVRHNAKGIKESLKEIVPEYTPQENEGVL